MVMLSFAGIAEAKKATKAKPKHDCHRRLDALGVPYAIAEPHKGIDLPVEVTGPLGGIRYKSWSKKRRLVLDCSLVYSLARAGRYFTVAGMEEAWYSSAYQRRNVRGTNRPSKHGNGLAIDIHQWRGDGRKLSVVDDYEQGLGDQMDCLGRPLTDAGKQLRTFWCRLDRSGMFRFIISPDDDADHHNHFHVEALPWRERKDLSRKAEERTEQAKAREDDHEAD
jgi:hypothetical protein